MKTTTSQKISVANALATMCTTAPKLRPNVSHFDALPNAALVSIQALSAINGQGVSTLWRHCKQDPDFPKPIRLSPGCTRFNVGEIRAYLAKKAEASARPARKQRSKGQGAA